MPKKPERLSLNAIQNFPKKQAILFIALAFLLMLSLAGLFLQFQQIESLKNEKAALFAEKSSLDSNFREFKLKSEQKISSLETLNNEKAKEIILLKERLLNLEIDYNKLAQSKQSLSEEFLLLKDESLQTIKSIEEFERKIEKSIEWFQENSLLGTSDNQKAARDWLEKKCFSIGRQDCSIQTACIYLVNSSNGFLGLDYIEDSGDKLTSIEDFLKRKGGDCEDFALFFKAELNYFLEKCSNPFPENIRIEGWVKAENPNVFYRIDSMGQWYLPGAKPAVLKQGHVFPALVCGQIYDFRREKVGGHCVVALTKKKISSVFEIFALLDGSPLIEPQDGSFLGNINEASSGVYLNAPSDKTKHDSFIYWVVTDNDFYMFDEEKAEWAGYAFFSEKLAFLKKRLKALVD
ncbi:MAG: hypothetical protein QXK06_04110 [Candidatus Diapherotrites archaeon]